MVMDNFLQYILPSLIAVLGVCLSSFASLLISNNTIKNQFETQKEEYELEKKTHAKKIHNEEVYKIYHLLSEKTLSMIQANLYLFPHFIDKVPIDEEEKKKMYLERYKNACSTFDDLNLYLHQIAPFICEEVYDYFNSITDECRKQIIFYPDFFLKERYGFEKDDAITKNQCWDRGSEIAKKQEEIIDFLRNKINELER